MTFTTFKDEMQYIFLDTNFIFMVILAVKSAGTDVISGNANNVSILPCYKNDLNDVSSGNFNNQKDEVEVFPM